jgi:S-methylmethionine-dependent homocysteine/selenocysteine methylase
MPTRSILDRLSEGEVLLMDGGTGTELQRRGVNVGKGTSIAGRSYTTSKGVTTQEYEGVWSAAANVDAPSVVRDIHADYLRLGADIIISNNFYTSRAMMAIVGEEDRWEEYTRLGAELAVQARDAVNAEAYVAGGFAPPYGGDLREEFEGQVRVLANAGVDVLLPEYLTGTTVHDTPISDCVTAVDACAAAGLPVFLGICNVSEKGTLKRGESFQELVAALKGRAVEGILLMCSRPEEISACLPSLRKAFDGPVGAYANLNYAYEKNPKWGSSLDEPLNVLDFGEYTPKRYAEFAGHWKEMGAQIIGGCCGVTPEHIEALGPVVKS